MKGERESEIKSRWLSLREVETPGIVGDGRGEKIRRRGGWSPQGCEEASREEEETLVWKLESVGMSICESIPKGKCGREPDRFKCTVYQHSLMLLVLSQPSRDATLCGVAFMCAALSNVAIMSSQIKRVHFITKLTKAFRLLHLVSEFLLCDSFSCCGLCEHMVYWKYNKIRHLIQPGWWMEVLNMQAELYSSTSAKRISASTATSEVLTSAF